MLLDAFPAHVVCPMRLREQLDGVDAKSLHGYRLFSGHLTGGFADFLGLPLKIVTLLRDPVQRSISHYAHVRRDPSSPFHALAQGLSLREFCLHPETRSLIQDYQARCLAGEACESPIRKVAPAKLPQSREGQEELLRRALATMDACVAVGVTENLSDTLAVFGETLGIEWSGVTPYENPSYNRPKAVDQETLAVIQDLTRCDLILYREAVSRLRERAVGARLRSSGGARSSDVERLGIRSNPARGGIVVARLAWPERAHRIKLGLSRAIGRLPRLARNALALLYMAYRLAVDRTTPFVTRIPLLLGVLYLFAPFDIHSSRNFILGHLDEAAVLAVGFFLSAALIGKKRIDEIKFAAISRFDL